MPTSTHDIGQLAHSASLESFVSRFLVLGLEEDHLIFGLEVCQSLWQELHGLDSLRSTGLERARGEAA